MKKEGTAATQGSRSAGRRRKQSSPAKSALLDEKRQAILDVAVRLFYERGYNGTTTELIAQELGVSKPYVYYYFKSKLDIFETLCWRPSEACFTVFDFPPDDRRPAHEKLADGIERLVAETVLHYPASFFFHLYPQVHRPKFAAAIRKLAKDFYGKMCTLLEQARRDGTAEFDCAKITALAACSISGFLFTWYRPNRSLSADEVVRQLVPLVYRVMDLRLGNSKTSSRPRPGSGKAWS